MAENKFIERLRGKDTAKAVLEIQNTGSKTTFTKMPQSSSDATIVYPDSNHNATAVLKNAINWKVINGDLDLSNDITGDGDDYVGNDFVQGISDAQGNNLWLNSSYTVPAEGMVFTKNTKWILKLCGDNLLENGGTSVDFTVVITLGQSNIISKSFTVREQASFFCKEMVIDFTESNASAIKLVASDKITLKLLSNSANASARIYHGMTTLTVLQRTVEAETVAFDSTTLEDLADTVSTHIADTNNPHSVTKSQVGLGNCDNTSDLDKPISTATQTALNGKVNIDGTSIMTGPLKMRASISFECAIAPYWHGVGFYQLNDDNSVSLLASIERDDGFCPAGTSVHNIGSSYHKWKDLYLGGKAYIGTINNGYDIAVPVTNSADTLALKSEVDLAANSGRMITAQGVWYAKMYAATVVPSSAEVEGRNYADFSQVDGQGNPIIVIYTYTSGAWDAGTTIVPPADYDGYVPITSKIWDIPEQTGQQGGRILWNHQSKEFTPYPLIVSFDGQNITNSTFSNGTITSSTFSGEATLSGVSTAPTPTNSSPNNQIATKEYIDSIIAQLDVPDMFDYKWKDCTMNRVGWKEADGNWINESDAEDAYNQLVSEISGITTQTETYSNLGVVTSIKISTTPYPRNPADDSIGSLHPYCWGRAYGRIYTDSESPSISDNCWSNPDDTTPVGTISDISDSITIEYYLASNGRKIVKNVELSDGDCGLRVDTLYYATGVAWYYVLDDYNQRFKLPRINPAKELLPYSAAVVGNGKVLGLKGESSVGGLTMNASAYLMPGSYADKTPPVAVGDTFTSTFNMGSMKGVGVDTNPADSGLVADLTNTSGYYVGKKHLYFYVG